jgi:transposase InsO family protein
MVSGLPEIEDRRTCDTYIVTKQRRPPFPVKAKFRADAALDLVHGDLCGLITPASPGGWRFFLLLVDDATRFMWIKLLTAKSDAAASIKAIKAAAEVEVGCPLRVLRTDKDGEFTGKELADFCTTEGLKRHFSAPYTPQQNEVVERMNQTVLATARAMLKEREMPPRYWGEAVTTADFLLNRAPTKVLDGKTSFEAYHGKKPAAGFLRTFGCLGFIKNKKPGLKKLDDRSAPMVFIGYSEGAKVYHMLEPSTGNVHVSRDVVFDESRGWSWTSGAGNGEPATQCDSTVKFYTACASDDDIDMPDQGGVPPSPPGVGSLQAHVHHHLLMGKQQSLQPRSMMMRSGWTRSTKTRLCGTFAWTRSSTMSRILDKRCELLCRRDGGASTHHR